MSPRSALSRALPRLYDLAARGRAALLGSPAPRARSAWSLKIPPWWNLPEHAFGFLKTGRHRHFGTHKSLPRPVVNSAGDVPQKVATYSAPLDDMNFSIFPPLHLVGSIYVEDRRASQRLCWALEKKKEKKKKPRNLPFLQFRLSQELFKAISCDNHKGFLRPKQ